MTQYIFDLKHLNKTSISTTGGKAANLGELSKIEGVSVPDGVCISTEAFKKAMGLPAFRQLLDQLSLLDRGDHGKIAQYSATLRKLIEERSIPEEILEELTCRLRQLGEKDAYAVRSSATAEDLPSTSFAGQQDTYLNVMGKESIVEHVRKCWASLFTERAVIYRMQNGFDHRKVHMAVVIQKMAGSEVSGVMFTADPLTSNRKILSIDASFGLGEALVSGLVNPDTYKVRSGELVSKKISTKNLSLNTALGGGIEEKEVATEDRERPALGDEQILQLERIGRRIEQHFGRPQDIEWCLAEGAFYIVQSRPITTLFPIPETSDFENHVYVSVGHQQMMTGAMRPLGLSLFQLTAVRPMYAAGGRLFVDITQDLKSPEKREILVGVLGKSDPLLQDALMTILRRQDTGALATNGIGNSDSSTRDFPSSTSNQTSTPGGFQTLNDYEPEVVKNLIQASEASLEELKHEILGKSGPALLDFVLQDLTALRKNLFTPQSFGVIMTAMNAASWINENMLQWLGEKNAADAISQSVANNVTSEMGLALMDVADVIRRHPQVVRYLKCLKDEGSLAGMVELDGGREATDAIHDFLNKYGMRCVGEIDITRARWSEKPTTLVPIILTNINHFEVNASHLKFEQGRQAAVAKEEELVDKLRQLPDGAQKVTAARRMIRLVRDLSGYREYPKYAIMNRYFVYKVALLKEAERLLQANVFREREDIYYLTFDELRNVVSHGELDYQIIIQRKDEYRSFQRLTPPRVMTSDGEIVTGRYKREQIPVDAIAGLAVSSGVCEGRARVILDLEDAILEGEDILVTTFTDPSWTPTFLSIKGLVTEVGGLMTHGAVIAREYGLPAVVGVENATKLIRDGQRIRVNGTEGYIELL